MRRLSPALALLALLATLAIVAACAAPAQPGWTYAPAPSVTAAPSGEASGSPPASASVAPSPTASAEESESPEPGESGAPSGGAGELTVTAPVGASTSGFEPTELAAAANTAFKVTFDNEDTGVPHNWVLKNADGSNVNIGDTTFFNGPQSKTYDVPALAAGEYPFVCEVHPQVMTGTLTVE